MVKTKKLTNLQLELIKIFNYQLNDNQLLDIKKLLSNYFAEKVSDDMDKLWEERAWTDKTMDSWLNEHLRTENKKM